ncbi:PilZ domain-containing protein [Methylorubrum salsuginis]|uniref:PilZ domain-containing protein n=1 Tax=Methylorubrum salsuginis TaxID=414703 RepID=A0A1I4L7B9_9HYPH|nr:PilZ domain-containing protein [Methylorubrum salsuginis]SFL86769.1 hypothetical protein SAMN04488125_1283 [Methylorubrum salsuginis]
MAEPSPWNAVPASRPVSVLAVPGRCLLEDGTEHACLASDLDADGAEIACSGKPGLGERVVCYLDGIGALRGRVERVRPSRFRIRLEVGAARRARILARIAWQEARTDEQRTAPRLVPVNDRTQIRLPDGRVVAARIVDLSMAGVALQLEAPADIPPPVGAVVRVGLRYAAVVRPTETGFAARFRLPFSRETFSPEVVL